MSATRIDLVFPRFKLLSGAERLILELAGALARKGHRPRVLCHQFDRSCRPLLHSGVELEQTGSKLDWSANRYLNAIADYVRVGTLRERLDPRADACVLYGPALGLLRGRGLETPHVYHCFEPPRALYQDRGEVLSRAGLMKWPLSLAMTLYRRADRTLVGRAPAVTASGPYAARRIAEVYGTEAVAITHGLARPSLDRHTEVERNPARLITVNYLHPRKRVDLAVETLARLHAATMDGDPVTLEVVGDGPERASLEKRAQALGVADRVVFSGFVSEERLAAHYRTAACYLHTAREESFGLSVIEAAYCGLPVVAVAEGGVVDNVVEGETGVLATRDAAALADAVTRILWSADGGRAMGARGRSLVDARYTWDRGAEDLLGAIAAARQRM